MTSRDASAYLPPAPFGGPAAALDVETCEAFARADAELALDTVGEAVRLLAVNDIPLRARVTGALVHLAPLAPEDFPPSTRALFVQLQARSTWGVSTGNGTIVATVDLVSDHEVSQLAELVCDLHTALIGSFVATCKVVR